jgi:hypothetical protein
VTLSGLCYHLRVTAAVTQVPPLTWKHRPVACEVDELASEFLRQESVTDSAYKTAIAFDEKLEIWRERLILMVEQFGRRNGELKLVGAYYEIVVIFPHVTVDPSMLRADPPVLQIRSRRTA